MKSIPDTPEAPCAAIVAFTAALLVAVLVLEHGFGQQPCALCLMQQMWVIVAGVLAAAGLAHNPRLGVYPLLVALAAVAGGGFAIRQLWVIANPESATCGAGIAYLIDAFPLDALEAMILGTGDCAEQPPTIPLLALGGFAVILILAVIQFRRI